MEQNKPFKPKRAIPRKNARMPTYARAFARPLVLSPAAARQVGVTPAVQRYVARFKAKMAGIALARAIVGDIASFEKRAMAFEEARQHWLKRSASEIIKSRAVFSAQETPKGLYRINGCTDSALAIAAALRAAKFRVLIVRAIDHTYVKFFYMNAVWIADTSREKRPIARKMTAAEQRLERKFRSINPFIEAPSLADAGIRNYENFLQWVRARQN